MYKGLHVKYQLVLYLKLEFAEEIFENCSNIKFREKPYLSYMNECNPNELFLVFLCVLLKCLMTASQKS